MHINDRARLFSKLKKVDHQIIKFKFHIMIYIFFHLENKREWINLKLRYRVQPIDMILAICCG